MDSDESYTPSEFDDSDEEFLLLALDTRDRPKNEDYLEFTIPQMNESEFLEHFRVSRRVVEGLVARYDTSSYATYQSGSHGKVETRSRFLIFLWYCGHQTASFRDVADRFNVSISTLEDIITTLTFFISNLSPTTISWPTSEEMAESEREFDRRGFPGAIGAIDGTHVRIDKPSEDPESYFNRKDFYSIQGQVVCDSRRKIIDAFVGCPGSVHDARSFRMSNLSDTLEEKCGEFLILGDSAYPCMYNLMTPFKDRGNLTAQQKRFNTILSKSRILIEHTFGIIKQKFRQLYHLKIRNMEVIVHFIRACFVLHNLALEDQFPEVDAIVPDASSLPGNGSRRDVEEEVDTHTGQRRRDRLCRSLT